MSLQLFTRQSCHLLLTNIVEKINYYSKIYVLVVDDQAATFFMTNTFHQHYQVILIIFHTYFSSYAFFVLIILYEKLYAKSEAIRL